MKKQFKVIMLGALIVLLFSGAAIAANVSFEDKKAAIEEKVAAGTLSYEAADKFLTAMQARMAACDQECDGTRQGADPDRERLGQKYQIGGLSFGQNTDQGNGGMNGNGNKGANGERTGK